MISFNNIGTSLVLPDPAELKTWLKTVIKTEGKKAGDLTYLFVDDEYLLDMNQRYLDHDTFTDIITFPMTNTASVISGEIYISVDRIRDNAARMNVDFALELRRVIVHGVLHLIGYGDDSDKEKAGMRAKEDYYLNLHP